MDYHVRDPATHALPKLLEKSYPQLVPFILSDLFDIYTKNNKVSVKLLWIQINVGNIYYCNSFYHRPLINLDDKLKLKPLIHGNHAPV